MILGISSHYHDSAIAVVGEGVVVFAAQEERYTRIKHDAAFPEHALKDAIKICGITAENLEAVVFYKKPFMRFERILENILDHVPSGLSSFLKSVPPWISQKLYIKQIIKKQLKRQIENLKSVPVYFSWHHLSHAASAFYPSPFEESAILTIDGVGEWSSSCIYLGEGRRIKLIKEMRFPDSIGFLYSSFTYFLGFKVNSGEYKLMGLAPYGDASSEQFHEFKENIYSELVSSYDDGSLALNMKYFRFHLGLKMINEKRWEQLFFLPKRNDGDPILNSHKNLALAIQEVLEEIVLKMARHAKEITGSAKLCLAGGVALNCVMNTRIKQSGLFDGIYIQPAAGDSGGLLERLWLMIELKIRI